MASVFILSVSLSFIYTLYLQIFSMNNKRVVTFAKILFLTSIIGTLGIIISSIIFYADINSIDNADLYGNLRDAFTLFAYPACFWSAISLIITTPAHFMGKKMAAIIPSICHLSALFILIYTVIFASLGKNFEGNLALNVYINIFGTSLSLLNLFPTALRMKKLSEMLLDKDYIYSRLHRNDDKHKKAQDRKKIKETKKRIKNRIKNK